jgi:hypothetical protein
MPPRSPHDTTISASWVHGQQSSAIAFPPSHYFGASSSWPLDSHKMNTSLMWPATHDFNISGWWPENEDTRWPANHWKEASDGWKLPPKPFQAWPDDHTLATTISEFTN